MTRRTIDARKPSPHMAMQYLIGWLLALICASKARWKAVLGVPTAAGGRLRAMGLLALLTCCGLGGETLNLFEGPPAGG
ncbi:hypothetical protein [Nonomuraea sp. bgisy101]|uniref:hypothetical protein n=1 Tax=Nonomuraea sp. bgisy101 TaxID=3413784 RepID=UPI003D709822